MAYLASFLMSAFSGLLVYLAGTFTKKVGLTIFAVTVVTSLSLGLYYTLKSLVASLAVAITNEWVLMGMGILWPSNAEACISAIFAAELAVYVFRVKKTIYLASMAK